MQAVKEEQEMHLGVVSVQAKNVLGTLLPKRQHPSANKSGTTQKRLLNKETYLKGAFAVTHDALASMWNSTRRVERE